MLAFVELLSVDEILVVAEMLPVVEEFVTAGLLAIKYTCSGTRDQLEQPHIFKCFPKATTSGC